MHATAGIFGASEKRVVGAYNVDSRSLTSCSSCRVKAVSISLRKLKYKLIYIQFFIHSDIIKDKIQ